MKLPTKCNKYRPCQQGKLVADTTGTRIQAALCMFTHSESTTETMWNLIDIVKYLCLILGTFKQALKVVNYILLYYPLMRAALRIIVTVQADIKMSIVLDYASSKKFPRVCHTFTNHHKKSFNLNKKKREEKKMS